MKVLVIQTAFIGDVVLATPIVEKLKAVHPGWTVDFLVRKGNESLLNNNPQINSILTLNKKKNKYGNLLSLIQTIRKTHYDYVINAQRFTTTGIITVLSGAKTTIGFDKNPLSRLFSKAVAHQIMTDGDHTHEVERNLSLIADLVPEGFARPRLYPSEADYAVVPTGVEYVCMAPASVWFTKQWPREKWIELIKAIPTRFQVYLIGGPGDVDLCDQICDATAGEHVHNTAGNLSFLESAALIDKAVMTFVNDSAPLHFASAMNAPVTAIFCSTVPAFGFGPLSDRSIIIETPLQLDCRPCGLHGKSACPLGHFQCADIPVQNILDQSGLLKSSDTVF